MLGFAYALYGDAMIEALYPTYAEACPRQLSRTLNTHYAIRNIFLHGTATGVNVGLRVAVSVTVGVTDGVIKRW